MDGMSSPINRFNGDFSVNTIAVIVCSALALYNALELELLIFTTFQSYRGLYFWALALASFGVIPYALGYMMEYFGLCHMALAIAIDTFGWSLMVTGQAVVLYSRLWLVFGSEYRRMLRAVKWMIIINAVVFHGTTTVAVYGSNFGTNQRAFGQTYNMVERIQMVGFCVQESILSGLYIWKALDIIRASQRKQSRDLMWQLFSINVLIIVLDLALLTMEFMSCHVLQQTVKGVTYSVKLKLEFAVLNKLVELSSNNVRANGFAFGGTDDFLDSSKTKWDIACHTPASSSSMHTYPKWMSDLEKSGIQRMEDAYSPAEKSTSWIHTKRNTILSTHGIDYFPNAIRPVSNFSSPRTETLRTETLRKGSATSLLYADAIRKIASPE